MRPDFFGRPRLYRLLVSIFCSGVESTGPGPAAAAGGSVVFVVENSCSAPARSSGGWTESGFQRPEIGHGRVGSCLAAEPVNRG